MVRKGVFTAIDVGTTKVCTIVADGSEPDGFRVLGVGIAPCKGLHKGLIVNIEEAKQSLRESVRKAEVASGRTVVSAYVGVTGRHISSFNNHGMVATTRNDRLVTAEDLERVLDTARVIEVPVDRKLLHVIPRGYALDGQPKIRNPVGMHGFRIDVETHIITAAAASIKNLVKCIRGIGVDVEDLILEPLASSETVLTPDEKETGVLLADIGGGTTDIAVFKDGSICHTAILPVAGYQLTRDVAIGLGVPFEIAEEIKKKYGRAISRQDGPEEEVGTGAEDGYSFAYRELCQILEVRTEEILRLILMELPRTDYQALVPEGVVLTGGSSNLRDIAMLAREVMRLPVRVGMPKGMYGLTDELQDPAYATSVGLLFWAKNHEVGEGLPSLELWQQVGKAVRHFWLRLKKLFS